MTLEDSLHSPDAMIRRFKRYQVLGTLKGQGEKAKCSRRGQTCLTKRSGRGIKRMSRGIRATHSQITNYFLHQVRAFECAIVFLDYLSILYLLGREINTFW
ncbi:hypothetical protein RHMOL_Rhmol03G0082800 [Rhododendron molle]|uniref:Uncharacterized protein n=1 Tax=Rhododendron molle TaxID=49168 RepID=A0ACC0PD27_RHOML|nr:hypothetical protein RHMOL_Rhmol03G0082800 [Rhododendron molle]